MPGIVPPKHSAAFKKTSSGAGTALPPIINSTFHNTLQVTFDDAAKRSPLDEDHKTLPTPITNLEIVQIVEAAKKSRDDKIAATERLNRVRRLPKKAPAKKLSLASSSRKSMIPQHTVAFQVDPTVGQSGPMMSHDESTVVIDLEGSLTSMPPSETSNAGLQALSTVSLQGGQSTNLQQQSHHSTSSLKGNSNNLKPVIVVSHRLRKMRSHTRTGSLPFSTLADPAGGKKHSHTKLNSISAEDVVKPSTQVQPKEEEQKPVAVERKSVSVSKPIIKKPNFSKQSSSSTHQGIKMQTQSVYGARPYVIPIARRITRGQPQSRSPQHKPLENRSTRKKKVPPIQYPRLRRKKHQQLPRQELSMAKGKS